MGESGLRFGTTGPGPKISKMYGSGAVALPAIPIKTFWSKSGWNHGIIQTLGPPGPGSKKTRKCNKKQYEYNGDIGNLDDCKI